MQLLRRPDPADLAFAGLLLLGAAIILFETRGMSFFGDEWDYVLTRRGMSPDVLLRPHGPHLTLVPVLVYKLLLKVFGAGSYLPFRTLAALDLVALGLALGVACRILWGRWWGLSPVLLLVTLGQAGVSLLWPFQVGYALALAAGVTSLLAVGRVNRRADAVACAALILSLASGSQGVGFLGGAALLIYLTGGWRQRWWVVAIPAGLYGLWYLHYGHQASETHLSLWSSSLPYAMDALSSTLAAIAGLSTVTPQTGTLDPTFGVPLALAAVGGLVVMCTRGRRPAHVLWAAALTLVLLMVAASLSDWGPFPRPPGDPRYLSSDAVLVLICICAAWRPPPVARTAALITCSVLLIVAATNARQYTPVRNFMLSSDVTSRGELAALQILRGVVPADFVPGNSGDPGVTLGIRAGEFFSAEDDFGLHEPSPTSLLRESEGTREHADRVLAAGEMLRPNPSVASQQLQANAPQAPAILSGTGHASPHCVAVDRGTVTVRALPGRYGLSAARRAPMGIGAGRFASGPDIPVQTLAPSQATMVTIPTDRAPQVRWRISIQGSGRICALGG